MCLTRNAARIRSFGGIAASAPLTISPKLKKPSLGQDGCSIGTIRTLVIQFGEGLGEENAVLADEFAIEVDFAATVVLALDGDEVPVDL